MKLDYSKVKIESGISIPSLRRKTKVWRKLRSNSLAALLSKLSIGQSVVLPIDESKIVVLSACVWHAKRRLGFDFTVRNYFTVKKVYRGARVWRIA